MDMQMRRVAVGLTVPLCEISSSISTEEWSYLAGFYDGEGCVSAILQVRPSGRKYYQLRFVISNTSFDLLKSLQCTFGGSIHAGSVNQSENRKQMYMWHIDSKQRCLPVLKGMLPYIRYKTDEVRLAIEFFEGIDSSNLKPLSLEELERRSNIVLAIRAIPGRRNGHGSVPVDVPEELMLAQRKCKTCHLMFEMVESSSICCSDKCYQAHRAKYLDAYNRRRRESIPNG